MGRLFGQGRYASVTATLALVIALGGTSYAAITITGKNVKDGSLKAADLGTGSVTSAKVRDGALLRKDFKQGQLPAGPQGPPGPVVPGESLVTQLGSGQTLRGYVEIWNVADAAGETTATSVSFQFPLAAAPAPHFIPAGAPNPPGCTGTPAEPGAAAGNLCVYEVTPVNAIGRVITGPAGVGSASRFGFGARASADTAPANDTPYGYAAVWAVTAP
jgi:hypothetical protein